MDRWAWGQLEPRLETRRLLPIGALLCVIHGPTAGRHWEASAARKQLHHAAAAAGVRRRFAPHQLRHAHAVEMAREGVPLVVIQRQLGHANLGITSVYLQGIDSAEIIDTVHGRTSPVIPQARVCRSGRAPGQAIGSAGMRQPTRTPLAGDEQVDRRPVFAALLSRRHRHCSAPLSLPDRAESSSLAESPAWATKGERARSTRRVLPSFLKSSVRRLELGS
jgi:Phage integrase family